MDGELSEGQAEGKGNREREERLRWWCIAMIESSWVWERG